MPGCEIYPQQDAWL
jgi:hypothetical protein